MILSEHARRWSEIQFYYFCLDMYHIRNNMIDVILMVEVISQIAELDFKMLKTLAARMISDPIYLPHRDEAISLAFVMGMNKTTIHKTFNVARSTIDMVLSSERNRIHTPFPQFSLKEDQELYKFCEAFKEIKKVGI